MESLGDKILTGSVLAFEQNGDGFARGDPPGESHDLFHGLRLGDDLAAPGDDSFSDIADRSDDAGQIAVFVVDLASVHHHQTLTSVRCVQPDAAAVDVGGFAERDQ